MAEYCGGTCSIVPVKRGSSASIASRLGRASLVATTRPSASSVSRSSPQRDGEAIGLAAVHHERHGLGRLAERDRQAAGGERIERAGMAGALAENRRLTTRDRVGRGHADRLVEHDPAMDVALVLLALFAAALDVFHRRRVVQASRIRVMIRPDRARGRGGPRVFAKASRSVPLRRIVRRRGSGCQVQISG